MTPLQKAAQELLELHLPTYVDTHVSQLRKALEAEQAQSVEPVAYSVGRSLNWHHGRGVTNAQLYAAPPAPPPASEHVPESCFGNTERAELISRLRVLGKSATIPVLGRAADMLEADAREIEATVRQVEILSDELSKCSKAQQVAVPAREPLTINQIDAIENKAYMKTTHKGRPRFEYVNAIIRAVEAHHKIAAKHLTLDTDWSAA